jgi:ATP-binding cassette subfamily B protein
MITDVGSVDQWFVLLLIAGYTILLILNDAANELHNVVIQFFFRYDMDIFLSVEIGKQINALDIEFFENVEYANLKNNVEDGFEWRLVDMLRDLMKLMGYGLSVLFSFGSLVYLYPIQAIIMFLAIIPSVIVDSKMQAGMWSIWETDTDTRRRYGSLRYYTRNNETIREVKMLAIQHFLIEELRKLMFNVFSKQKKLLWKRSIFLILTSMLTYIAAGYFIYDMVLKVISGTVLVGTLSFFVSSIFNLRSTFTSALFYLNSMISGSRYAGLLFEFLDMRPKIVSKPGAFECTGSPEIEFRDVSFKYPGTEAFIFKHLNVKIAAGEKVAIVGENGAGKSTLIKLLTRFYDVTEGEILINGVDIKEYSVESLRKNFAVLLQNFMNFGGFTLEKNIAFGDLQKLIESDAVGENIVLAAKNSMADQFIVDKKDGFKTLLGRDFGGEDFSGGERQRIALARTFFKDAGLVILDEPTSAVDAKAEAEIFEALREHLTGKTVIFVSHRFSTVRKADRIIVIEQGEIIEDGTHEELIAIEGVYKSLYTLQAKAYE